MEQYKETEDWDKYLKGIDYKTRINLFEEVNKAERFYSGDQWNGVISNGLPQPIFNVLRRIIQYKTSSLMSSPLKMNFTPKGISDDTQDINEQKLLQASELLTKYSETMWDRVDMNALNEEGLKDASLTGDMITYWYFNPSIDVGNGVMGDVVGELIDNVNYFAGNVNDPRINDENGAVQPYIILSFRNLIDDVKKEAKANGLAQEDIDKIVGDKDNLKQSGDRSRIELDDNSKCLCLLKMWQDPKTNTIFARKSTKYLVYSKGGDNGFDTGLRRYPVALMNYEKRKNSVHGISEAYGIIPNQIFINKMFAMALKFQYKKYIL